MKREQKKILTYIQSGSLLNLKNYLQKLQKEKRNLSKVLNTSTGKQNRTPLHIACLLGDDALVRCLVKHGASSTKLDYKNNTPVHLAAKFVAEDGNYPDFKLLLDPLVRTNPEVLHKKNSEGNTPAELLNKAKEMHNLYTNISSEDFTKEAKKEESEADWKEKLQNEQEQDLFDQCGWEGFSYNEQFACNEEYNTYDQWADQIASEYRKHQDFLNGTKIRNKQNNKNQKRKEMEDLTRHLNKDYEEYVKQAKRMRKEVMMQKQERAHEQMTAMKSKKLDSDVKLRYNDIPWPCSGNAEDMAEIILSGAQNSESSAQQKRYVMRQLVLWHPDKFEQRCGKNMHEDHRDRILSTVKSISQELNKFLDSLKT